MGQVERRAHPDSAPSDTREHAGLAECGSRDRSTATRPSRRPRSATASPARRHPGKPVTENCLDGRGTEGDNRRERLPRNLSNREPESDWGRQIAMKSVAWGLVAAMGIAVVLSGCGSSSPTTGVLMGRAWSCSFGKQVSSTTVYVFASIYAGKDSAALQRVNSLGVDSGERVVATQRMVSGDKYRFVLRPQKYVVYDSGAGFARLVTVTSDGTARADFPHSCL